MKIKLDKYGGLFKTKKAADYFIEVYSEEELEVRADIFREYIPKAAKYLKKKVGKVSWRDLADRVFSDYVRLFYADDYGYVRCFTSGVRLPRYESECGHYRSRDYLKYRFEILNCHPQTHHDNVHLKGNYRNYHKNMVAEYGEEVEEKLWNDKELVDRGQARYEDRIYHRYSFVRKKKRALLTS